MPRPIPGQASPEPSPAPAQTPPNPPDVLDEVECAGEASLHHFKVVLALGRVAAQRQDVGDAILLGLRYIAVRYSTVREACSREGAGGGGGAIRQAAVLRSIMPPPPLTLVSASFSFSTGMLVQVRCIMVSTPTCALHTRTHVHMAIAWLPLEKKPRVVHMLFPLTHAAGADEAAAMGTVCCWQPGRGRARVVAVEDA